MPNEGRIKQLRDLLQSEPDDIFLNYALGMEYAADEPTYQLAAAQFSKVLILNPEYIAAYYQSGKLSENMGKVTEALELFKIGLQKAKEQKNNKAINEFGEAIFMLED